MKKFILTFGLLALLAQTNVMAQDADEGEVIFTAILEGAFNLVVVDGDEQTATFSSADDYNNGVIEAAGIVPGYTTVAMEATGNWNLKIHALDFTPTLTATGSIPINNLGVWCDASGEHQFGTEVSCSHQSAIAAHGLTNTDYTLIDLMTDNSGDESDNLFVLHWLMGTMQGSMNSASMFSQLSDNFFSQGTYTTTIILTMTEIL